MSADSVTTVTSESWFGRIGGAIKGILVGLVLFVIAFPLLFWNEGRAVKRYKTLKEGGKTVISVTVDSVDAANSAKLIHVTGKADTDATLTDPQFGVSANALRLRRIAEMYQWEEGSESKTKKKLGGGTETVTTYTYSKDWSDTPIKSANFEQPGGHENPGRFPYDSTDLAAEPVSLGDFTLSPSLVRKINNFTPLAPKSDAPLPPGLAGKARMHGGGFYIGANPGSPQVGDVRVRFEVAEPTEVSVIAKQSGTTFEPFAAKTGGTIELLQVGAHTAEAMIQQAQEMNKMLAWIIRAVGFVLMLIGLNLILKPLSVIADVVPIVGSIVGAGTGVIAFLVAVVLSLVTIAIAWIVYRPLLGIALLVVAVGAAVAIKTRVRKKGAATSQAPPAA